MMLLKGIYLFFYLFKNSLKNYESWEKSGKKLMNMLCKIKDSELFHKPVDPVLLGIPDYFDIIKHPMDFATIKVKLIKNKLIK